MKRVNKCMLLSLAGMCLVALLVTSAAAQNITHTDSEVITVLYDAEGTYVTTITRYVFTVTDGGGDPVEGAQIEWPIDCGSGNSVHDYITGPTNADGITGCILPDSGFTDGNGNSVIYDMGEWTICEGCGPIGCCEYFIDFCGVNESYCCNCPEDVCNVILNIFQNLGIGGGEWKAGYYCNFLTDECEPNTLIELSALNARAGNRSATIAWSTAAEIDNAGFNIYRSESIDSGYEIVNDGLIPADGAAYEGAEYEFIDDGVRNRKAYYYMLEDVDLNGKTTRHGPVIAIPRLILR